MDLACIRYSGRVAPPALPSHVPNLPPWVMIEAESREDSSAWFNPSPTTTCVVEIRDRPPQRPRIR